MVLNNYWKALDLLRICEDSGDANATIDIGLKGLQGEVVSILYRLAAEYTIKHNLGLKSRGISARVGTGTGTIQPNDYSLFEDCTSDFLQFSVSNSLSANNNGYSQIVTITGINNTSSDITITEVGITKTFCTNRQMGIYTPVMFVKMLLDESVTVAPASPFSLSIEWLES